MKEALRALQAGWPELANRPSGVELVPMGEGHINETILITAAGAQKFVLQRINQTVFADPGRVMSNLVRVLRFLKDAAPGMVPALEFTQQDQPALVDDAGQWWRLWHYVEESRSLTATHDVCLARAAGAAFGDFQKVMTAFPKPHLPPTIPGFMELDGYLQRFDRAVSANPSDAAALAERSFIDARRYLAERFPRGNRIIHGDCKLNNLLFAASRASEVEASKVEVEVVSVLDLDTVMLGHWAWDFGDLARSLLSSVVDPDVAIVSDIDSETGMTDLFSAVVDGFLSTAELDPTIAELVEAPGYVAYMLGVRFLTDHLEGDRYFKVAARGDNLTRAAQQFALVRRLEESSEVLAEAVAAVAQQSLKGEPA